LTAMPAAADVDYVSCVASEWTSSIGDPWQVAPDGKWYMEERRPNANCDP